MADTAFTNPVMQHVVGDAAEGIIFVGTDMELTQPESPAVQKLRERYRHKYEKEAIYFIALAYDALAVIDAIAKEGKPFTQETFQVLNPWEGLAYQVEFLPGGECDIPTFPVLRHGGKNIRLK